MRMMTCTGCVIDGACTYQDEMRAKLKGLGIRSLKFACKWRHDVFQPGEAVIFTTFISDEDEAHRGGVQAVDFAGYVIKQMGGKVFGFIKPGTEEANGEGIEFEPKAGGYVKMPLSRVKADPARPTANATACDWCNSHVGLGAECRYDPNYTPASKCLSRALSPTPAPKEDV